MSFQSGQVAVAVLQATGSSQGSGHFGPRLVDLTSGEAGSLFSKEGVPNLQKGSLKMSSTWCPKITNKLCYKKGCPLHAVTFCF